MHNIKYIKGNLLDLAENGHFDIVIQSCNCFNILGAGIAKQIADRYPSVVLADNTTSRGDIKKLGQFTVAYLKEPQYQFIVINLYGQYSTGLDKEGFIPTDYRALYKGFTRIKKWLDSTIKNPNIKIGLPLLGAGLGGASWEVVEAIIKSTMPDLDITVVLYQK